MARTDLDGYLKTIVNPMRVKRLGLKPITRIKINDSMMLKARINHGRWIVDCPYCEGAEAAWKEEKLFLCMSCWNNGTNEFIPVEFPDEIEDIESELSKRVKVENQNWVQGETMIKLKAENEAHPEEVD